MKSGQPTTPTHWEKTTKKDQSKTESFLYVGGKLNSINTQVLDATGTLINLQREKCARSTRSKSKIQQNSFVRIYFYETLPYISRTQRPH